MTENIRANINRLIAAYESQLQKNLSLEAELESYRQKVEKDKEKIELLTKQIDNLSLKAAFSSGTTSSEEAKVKIDKMIHEIDRCISLIEK